MDKDFADTFVLDVLVDIAVRHALTMNGVEYFAVGA